MAHVVIQAGLSGRNSSGNWGWPWPGSLGGRGSRHPWILGKGVDPVPISLGVRDQVILRDSDPRNVPSEAPPSSAPFSGPWLVGNGLS